MAAERRKAELEEKRRKLAALRAEREERRANLSSQTTSRSISPTSQGPVASSRAQLDDLISSLLSPSTSRPLTPANNAQTQLAASTSQTEDAASASGKTQTSEEEIAANESLRDVQPSSLRFEARTSILPVFTETTQDLFELPQQVNLSYQSPQPIQYDLYFSFKPKITYDKAVQTVPVQTALRDDAEISSSVDTETEPQLRARLLKEFQAERAKLDAEIEVERAHLEKEKLEARRKGLKQEELQTVLTSEAFLGFLDRSTKVTERALSDSYDYLKDYSVSSGGKAADSDDSDEKRVYCTHTFSDPRWTKNRAVAAVDWSSKFQELSVASYTKNPSSTEDPDGIVCVWNLHLKDRPEFVFHSQSDVLSVLFSPFHPNLIIGGTYSGQILLWDTRARSLPVLKTPLSASGHTHPVYSLSVTGTHNAHHLVSASSDGIVCAWMLDMLAKPSETLELSHPAHPKTDEVSVTCLAFPSNEAATFWVGTEEGNVYSANRYDRAGHKAGLIQADVYKGHSGPVLGIDFHPSHGPVDFGDLFLTCGVDWTTRIWRSKTHSQASKSATAFGKAASAISPVCTFEEAEDYIFDVKWHPAHPGMFGTVDGTGMFHLWNLNADNELPVVTTKVNQDARRSLNKLAWEKRTGRRAIIGASDGSVYIYDIGDMSRPRENEWDQTRRALARLSSSAIPKFA